MTATETLLQQLEVIQKHIQSAREHTKSAELNPILQMLPTYSKQLKQLRRLCDELGCLAYDLAQYEVAHALK